MCLPLIVLFIKCYWDTVIDQPVRFGIILLLAAICMSYFVIVFVWYRVGKLFTSNPNVADAIGKQSWSWMPDRLYSVFVDSDPRQKILNGRYFTKMLAKSLANMRRDEPLLRDDTSFDLFVTQTDLHGWPRRLQVHSKLNKAALYERVHAHVMHFRHTPNCKLRNYDLH